MKHISAILVAAALSPAVKGYAQEQVKDSTLNRTVVVENQDDNHVDEYGRGSYGDNALEGQPESVEDDTGTKYLFRAEFYARNPCLGQSVTQAVGVEHTQYDANDEGAE